MTEQAVTPPHSPHPLDLLASLGPTVPADERIQMVHSILDAAPIGMAVTSAVGQILWVNVAFCRISRRSETELLGGDILALIDPCDRDVEAELADRLLSGKVEWYEKEERWLSRDRGVTWFVMRASIALNTEGRPLALAGSNGPCLVRQIVDVTDRKQAELERDRVRGLLEQRNQALERSNEELTQFASLASHDLSEPLRVIAGHVELLANRYRGQLGEDADRWIGFAVEGCLRQRNLIDALLEYSRVDQRATAPVNVSMSAVVEGVLRDLSPALEAAGADVTVGDLPDAAGDPVQITRLVANLVSNAVKFRSPDRSPRVRISVEWTSEDQVVYRVEDNGIGIPPEQRDRVFPIFQRLHSRRDYEGTGIGLAIARKVVAAHGGRIWIEESPSGGSTFCFTLGCVT